MEERRQQPGKHQQQRGHAAQAPGREALENGAHSGVYPTIRVKGVRGPGIGEWLIPQDGRLRSVHLCTFMHIVAA